MQFVAREDFARELDAADPVRQFRDRFHLPRDRSGEPLIYFVGNSLGLMPKSTREAVNQELEDWATRAVDAHFEAANPWYSYHEPLREPAARIVGARPNEVVCMNSLTVNLHLLMATFYRPTKSRFKIVMEEPAFPSDTYAVKSQIGWHGLDPAAALLPAKPGPGRATIAEEDLEELLHQEGEQIALVLLGGVNFVTGQFFDIPRITAAAQSRGCTVGVDLAHAAGNVPLQLHDWNVDFAAWCSYKYLNSGPGAVAGAFVHERHAGNVDLPRLAGWWGNDPATRFRMQLQPEFVPVRSADAWAVSNPPILALAPLRTSFEMFDEAGGIAKLREKSIQLTGYLEFLLRDIRHVDILTPENPASRGCQLSLTVAGDARAVYRKLEAGRVRCDFREPNVIRVAPTPLYNTFEEVWRFSRILGQLT